MTRKPCPCCKEVISSRKADDICYECREKVNSIERLKTIITEGREKTEKTMPIIVGPAPHWNKYFHFPGRTNFQGDFQRLFFELAIAASVKSEKWHDLKEVIFLLGPSSSDVDGKSSPEAHRYINQEVAKAIMTLHSKLEPFAAEMYNLGLSDAVRIRDKLDEIRKIIRS